MDPQKEALIKHLPTPFQIFRHVTGSDHLHFGLFEFPMDNIIKAQDRMMQKVLSFFPQESSNKSVLDVGCGLGCTSVELARRGFHVTAIAPEAELIAYAKDLAIRSKVDQKIEFHSVRLQDIPPEMIQSKSFDVILFQESLQYVHPLDIIMKTIYELVSPGGYLIISDQIMCDMTKITYTQFHKSSDILHQAKTCGFRLVSHQDLTKEAKMTGGKCLSMIAEQRGEIISRFRETNKQIINDIDICLRNGKIEADWYDQGLMGYELFVFACPE